MPETISRTDQKILEAQQNPPIPIAVIDDTEQNLYTIARYLRRAGFEVWEGRSGADALRLAHNKPELIILDVKLPDMLGYEVCRKIKANPATAAIPVMHTSATYLEVQDKVEGLEGGADAYLTAPIKPEELVATVKALLRMHDAEKRAEAVAGQWQTTFDALSTGVCLIDRTGTIERCNAVLSQVASRPCSEIVGRSFEDLARWTAITTLPYTRMMETQHRETLEIQARDRWWRVTVDPVFDKDGLLTGAVCVLADISERKRSEVQLRRSERNLVDFFENAPLGLHWVNSEGVILRANRAELEMLGYVRKDYVGRNIAEFHVSQEVIQDILERLRRGETIHNQDAQLRCSDGSIKDVILSANGLWEEGQFVHSRCFTRDITARKQAERELAAAQQQLLRHASELEQRVAERTAKLQETNRALESFCYSIAHDLRAPARAMQGLSGALLDDYGATLDDIGKDYANRIKSSAARMDQLIQDLLAYGRLSHMELPMSWVDVSEVVQGIVIELRQEIHERQATVQAPPQGTLIWANPTALQQVLSNLICNALQFNRTGTPPVVRTRIEKRDDAVRVSVEDNGMGIAQEYHQRIFEVFERIQQAHSGTGIGLALVKRAVERMGGRLGVDSKVGEGSRFWFELPNPPE